MLAESLVAEKYVRTIKPTYIILLVDLANGYIGFRQKEQPELFVR